MSTFDAGGQRRVAPGHPPLDAPPPDHEGLTLRDYLAVVWRRKWVILLVVAVATVSAYFFSARQPDMYAASADLLYTKQIDVANPLTGGSYTDVNERNLELRSVANILASPEMTKRAGAKLAAKGGPGPGYSVSAEPLSDSSGGSSSGTNVVRITAESESPELAAAAANAYADAFVEYRRETVVEQIDRAIEVIGSRAATYQGAAKQSTDYLVLEQRLQDLEILKATATGNFTKLVPATVPATPYAPQPLRSAILGFGVGLFAGIGLAFLLEQFDTRVRRPEQVVEVLRQPVLGRVPRISRRELGEGSLTTLTHPDGHVAEAFRMIRTNLDFMAVDAEVRSIVLTSSIQGEGKSVAVANLAVTMALAGKKVIVVDADLRRPRQHKLFGLANDAGVSTVVASAHGLGDAIQAVNLEPQAPSNGALPYSAWAKGSETRSRLFVLTSGPIPPNPGEIVASRRFATMLEHLSGEADVVLVDTPAMLAVGDTSAIAAYADGLIFLVDMDEVRRPQLQSATQQLARLPIKQLGTIIRAHSRSAGQYYYSPGYYYHYRESDEESLRPEERRRGPGRRRRDLDRGATPAGRRDTPANGPDPAVKRAARAAEATAAAAASQAPRGLEPPAGGAPG